MPQLAIFFSRERYLNLPLSFHQFGEHDHSQWNPCWPHDDHLVLLLLPVTELELGRQRWEQFFSNIAWPPLKNHPQHSDQAATKLSPASRYHVAFWWRRHPILLLQRHHHRCKFRTSQTSSIWLEFKSEYHDKGKDMPQRMARMICIASELQIFYSQLSAAWQIKRREDQSPNAKSKSSTLESRRMFIDKEVIHFLLRES